MRFRLGELMPFGVRWELELDDGLPRVPGTPTGLSASSSETIGRREVPVAKVMLRWMTPMLDGGEPIIGYNIYAGTEPGTQSGVRANREPVPDTTYTVTRPPSQVFRTARAAVRMESTTPLASGTEYFFTVTAVNAKGEGPPSNEASAIAGTL